MALIPSASAFGFLKQFTSFTGHYQRELSLKATQLRHTPFSAICSYSPSSSTSWQQNTKRVWIWSESQEVMTAAVERGWSTFIFSPNNQNLADEWSSIALIRPLFIREDGIFDGEGKLMATVLEIFDPQQLKKLQPAFGLAENVVVDLLDWQIMPAENIVASFQRSQKTVFAISKTAPEARIFLEALEQGLGGVVLKVDDTKAVLELKEYFDRINESLNVLSFTKAIVTRVEVVGMGDRVCVDLCSLMRPGEGLLVGSFSRGLFLVHSECLESNYVASRPFRVNAGPVHTYVAAPGGKTCYLSELKAGSEIIVVDPRGRQRTAIVGRVKIETRPLILVEAKGEKELSINESSLDSRISRAVGDLNDQSVFTIILQNVETVALVGPCPGNDSESRAIPVTSLKVGDEVTLRLQGGARHTGIEIEEFIVEK